MSASESTVPFYDDRRWKNSFLIAVLLFVGTTVVFSTAWKNEFVEWDDQVYVYEQPRVLEGIRWAGLLWAMNARVCANWHPLTMISLQLDAQLFGPGPFGFHLTSVLLHATNAALAFCAILLLTRCRWKSAIVAALFALHPMRVESVAWVAERKDVLSGFFFFLTLIAYARYVRAPSIYRYLLVALCLALGLCSKSMLVTTPCVLLLLDYWPLGRGRDYGVGELKRFGRLSLDKLPLLGLSVISSILTIVYQKNAMLNLSMVPVKDRPEIAIRGFAAYLVQTCWPTTLSHFYRIPESSVVEFAAASSLLMALTAIAIWQRNRRPYLLVGWLWFLGMLVPVSGIIQVGFQQRADRYLYLPQLGLFLAAVWFVADMVKTSRRATIVSSCLFVAISVCCGGMTVTQIQVWKNTKTLWTNAYRLDPRNRPALFSLFNFALAEAKGAEAVRLADELIVLENERYHDFLLRVCDELMKHGHYEASVRAFDRAISIGPNAELFLQRGEALAILGRWEDAVQDYAQVVLMQPNAVPLHFCLAHALSKIGKQNEAHQIAEAALRRFPRWPENALTSAWKSGTNPESDERARYKAVWLAEEANSVTGDRRWEYLDVLAAAYASRGQFENAVKSAQRALQLAENEQKSAQAAIIRSRLDLYKMNQPYVEKK